MLWKDEVDTLGRANSSDSLMDEEQDRTTETIDFLDSIGPISRQRLGEFILPAAALALRRF